MKRIKSLGVFILLCASVWGQSNVVDELKNLSDSADYMRIIVEYAPDAKDYPPEALYYIGYAYFMSEDEEKCIAYMDMILEKDADFADAHYLKGVNLMFVDRLQESMSYLRSAIRLDPEKARYHRALGDLLDRQENYEEAIASYKLAIENGEEKNGFNLFMIANSLLELSKKEEALKSYYEAKELTNKNTSIYNGILRNIGFLESSAKNSQKAEEAFLEAMELFADDFYACSQLIQLYNRLEQYGKIQQYKDVLYDLHSKQLLVDTNYEDMFCIDQFELGGRTVRAFERYEVGESKNIYEKIRFYILDEKGELDYKIQTEYSPALAEFWEGESGYFLCAWKDDMHLNYGKVFTDDSEYKDIKKAVLDILAGETEPAASLSLGKGNEEEMEEEE